MRAPEDEPLDFEDSQILEKESEEAEEDEVATRNFDRKDRYVGGIDPVTGLRHGKGTYKYYTNQHDVTPYFIYEGDWVNGIKHGDGIFRFADGGFFEGKFEDGEIKGYGIRVWPNGDEYKGNWKDGEKHGEGTLENHETGESYVGDWVMNLRHGGGKWTKPNKEVVEGEFRDHLPQGQVSMRLVNGDLYKGNVERGVIHGKGEYRYLATKMCYEGDFADAKREGQGKFYAMNGNYTYTGEFKEDKPTIEANQMIYHQEVKEEEPDDKKKKDKKGEPEEDENPNKIVYEIGTSEPIKIELRHVFQGEDYEDDTPLDEEELKKQAAKKGKGNEEPEVRMVTPDPIVVHQDSGRIIVFELGRKEEQPVPEDEPEKEPEVLWTLYKFKQDEPNDKFEVLSQDGIVTIEGLTYALSDEFKQGKYEIVAKDRTPFIKDHLNEVRISLEIIDPEDPPVPAKGKKK